MVSIVALWLPILLSAVAVFIVSSLIHTMLRYHANDYQKLPDESAVADALRKFNIPSGQYMMPRPASSQDMKSPEYKEKVKKGPSAILVFWDGGSLSMAPFLIQWFLYCLFIGMVAAYIAGRALGPGASYLSVFRFVGAAAFASYAIAGWQESIWFRRPFSVTLKNTFDGLLYALLTAGMFGWLWPR